MKNNLLLFVGAWSMLVFFLVGCKPDKITKWRYVPEEVDNAEVILTINETQGLAEVQCTPTYMYQGIHEDSVSYSYWFRNGWKFQIVADTFYLQMYVRPTGQNITGIKRMVIQEKSDRMMILECFIFPESAKEIHRFITKYKFERLP